MDNHLLGRQVSLITGLKHDADYGSLLCTANWGILHYFLASFALSDLSKVSFIAGKAAS